VWVERPGLRSAAESMSILHLTLALVIARFTRSGDRRGLGARVLLPI
jgi:hypothetical protein